jgi:hypothetical protein
MRPGSSAAAALVASDIAGYRDVMSGETFAPIGAGNLYAAAGGR